MISKKVRALLLAVVLPFLSVAEEGDWGYAHINFIKANLNEDWSILSRSQATWRDDISDFFFWYADAGLAYSISPAWRVEAAYRHLEWNFGGGWLVERRPLVNLVWFGKIKDTRINNQARLEYRDYAWDRKNDVRFRNRTHLAFPWEILPGGVKPFLEEEFFIGKNSEKMEMNWVTAGLYWKGSGPIKLKAGYRWMAVRVGKDWENRNQLVSGLALFF